MSTIKQQRIVEKISGNVRTKKQLLKEAGYSESMQDKPSVVLESKGIKELVALGESMGLDDKSCLEAVIKAIKTEKLETALNAVKYWFGLKYPDSKDKPGDINIGVQVITQQDQEEFDRIQSVMAIVGDMSIEELKQKLS